MERYVLKDEEVYLFKGKARLFEEDPTFEKAKAKTAVEVRLTNLNLILNFASPENDDMFFERVHGVDKLKIFNDKYQIVRNDNTVSMYFTDGDVYLEFDEAGEAKDFVNIGLKLASGRSKFVRAAKSVQNEIKSAEETLDIDIKEAAKKVAMFAGSAYLGAASCGKPIVGVVARAISKKKGDKKK